MSYLALSQLLLTGLFYFFYFRRSRVGLLIALFCVCLISAVVTDFGTPEYLYIDYLKGRIGAATPALLWLLAHALFIDDRRVPPLAWLCLIGYQLLRGYATYAEEVRGVTDSALLSALNLAGLMLAFGLAVHVVAMALKDIGNDLLEERRRLRGPFAAGLGLVMALMVASIIIPSFLSESAAAEYGPVAALIGMILVFSFFLTANLLTFRLSPDSQLIHEQTIEEPSGKPNRGLQLADSDLKLMEELEKKMLEQRLFAEPDLTIGQLAKQLGVQEYKLRVIINRELGYRNFNQFLNFYRINAACRLLEQKSSFRNISIVAQDVGFASLSPFNHAFKKLKGCTPTEYKNLHAAPS